MAAKKAAAKKTAVTKGMGFNAAAKQIAAKSNMPPKVAAAILASQTRKASPAAKKANPALRNVLPKKKGK